MEPVDLTDHLFGDPGDFAIAIGLDSTVLGCLWGHVRLWCAGVPLGNPLDSHSATYTTHRILVERMAELDQLWDPVLNGRSDSAMFDLLDEKVYGDRRGIEVADHLSYQEIEANSRRFGRFDFLTNWGEFFDGYKAFIVSPPGDGSKVLYRTPADKHDAAIISRQGFAAAVAEFDRWYIEQEQRVENGGGG